MNPVGTSVISYSLVKFDPRYPGFTPVCTKQILIFIEYFIKYFEKYVLLWCTSKQGSGIVDNISMGNTAFIQSYYWSDIMVIWVDIHVPRMFLVIADLVNF